MKRIINILLVNIIVFFTILFILNAYFERNLLNSHYNIRDFIHKIFNENLMYPSVRIDNIPVEKNLVEQIDFNDKTFKLYCGEERVEFNETNDNPPIVVLGCSYAYGHGLKKEESFPHNLLKETGHSIYSYAGCGGDIITSAEKFLSDNKNAQKTTEAEYIIYLYMHDHINRIMRIKNLYYFYDDLFSVPNNKIHKFLLNNIFLYKYICTAYQLNTLIKKLPDTETIQKFLKIMVMTTYKKIKLHSPNSKFIIVIYDEKFSDEEAPFTIYYNYSFINSPIWDELENETNGDIQIVRTKDIMGFLFDSKYKLKKDISDWHPNARVWEEFTPKFVSQYIK